MLIFDCSGCWLWRCCWKFTQEFNWINEFEGARSTGVGASCCRDVQFYQHRTLRASGAIARR